MSESMQETVKRSMYAPEPPVQLPRIGSARMGQVAQHVESQTGVLVSGVVASTIAGALGMRESPLSGLYIKAYRFRVLRPLIRRILIRCEGGIMRSRTWRRIMVRYEGVVLGDFSYSSSGIKGGVFPEGTRIGHFSSVAAGVQILRRNHPPGRFSQHPVFFNRSRGLVKREGIPEDAANPITIGSDVWIGMNAIICPGCHDIGDGAIIAAGAVVTRDVPAYTIIGGNPARTLRKRFEPEVENVVADSKWWLRPWPQIAQHLDLFTADISDQSLRRFAAAFPPCVDLLSSVELQQ